MVENIIDIGLIQITQSRSDMNKGSIGFTVTTDESRIKNIIYYYDHATFTNTLEKVKQLHRKYELTIVKPEASPE